MFACQRSLISLFGEFSVGTFMPLYVVQNEKTWDVGGSPKSTQFLVAIDMGDTANRRKSVSFQDTVTYREICPLAEIDEAEIRTIWYSDDEYSKIKKIVTATVKKAEKGDPVDEAKGITMRGLEGRTKFGARRRKNNKKAALDVVWTTQIELWKKRMDQPLAIAAAYRVHSTDAKYRAKQAAHKDELFVKEFMRNGE